MLGRGRAAHADVRPGPGDARPRLVGQHEPPLPSKVKKQQVTKLAQALRQGTPNRNRIAMQMVKDMLDESSFDAGPGHVIPGKVGEAMAGVAGSSAT